MIVAMRVIVILMKANDTQMALESLLVGPPD